MIIKQKSFVHLVNAYEYVRQLEKEGFDDFSLRRKDTLWFVTATVTKKDKKHGKETILQSEPGEEIH